MLTKLASLLATAKGAAAATLIAGSAVAGGTVAAVPEAREAVTESVSAVTTTLGSAVAAVAKAANERRAADTSCGKPEVVAQRNEADKQLRDAFHDYHQTLTDLKGGTAADHQKVNAVVKPAQEELRGVLKVALVDVARETQGRTGQVAKANAAAADQSTSASAGAADQSPSASACDASSGKQDVTLNTTIAAIVKDAIDDMADIVEEATTEAGAVLPTERGKPANDPARGNDKKPADAQQGQPADKPGNKPSTPPGRTR